MAKNSALPNYDVERITRVLAGLQFLVDRATEERYQDPQNIDDDVTCFTNGLIELEAIIWSIKWSGRRKHAGHISKILVSSALSYFSKASERFSGVDKTVHLVDLPRYLSRYCAPECSDALRQIRFAISM